MISDAEKIAFTADHASGMTNAELATKYKITTQAVRSRVHVLGLGRTKPAPGKYDNTLLDSLISSGKSNAEIRVAIPGIRKDRLAYRRKSLGMLTREPLQARRVMDEDADPYSEPKHLRKWEGPCPKCGNPTVLNGGVRFGQYIKDFQMCLTCGQNNEQESFYDAHRGMRVEI